MEWDKSSVWGSFKEKTRPFLQNLNIKKTKKSSSKVLNIQKRHRLDHRMSVSVPDMFNIEETDSSSEVQVSSTSFLTPLMSVNRNVASVRNSCEKKTWTQEECVHTEITVTKMEVSSTSEPVERSEPGDDVMELLQRERGNDNDSLETFEDQSESTDLESSMTSQQFEDQMNGGADSLGNLPSLTSYLLAIHLKEGRNLVIRDRSGTSDPYVKFKLNKKTLYKSRVIYKTLNPVWDETFVLPINKLNEKLHVKVYDRDLTTDDFMGSAYLALRDLELNRPTEKIFKLEDPSSLEEDMGVVVVEFTLSVRQRSASTQRWSTSKRLSLSKSNPMQNLQLSESMRKSQLWNGIITITLLEGRNILEGSTPASFVIFRLGDQRYKSKTLCQSANPQWRERFDFHYFSNRTGLLEIEVWGKDNRKHEELLGTCKVDIAALPLEQRNRLELPLENSQGLILVLITVALFSGVSISDLCVCPLGEPSEREQISQRYCIKKSFQNIKDVGFLQVKILRAEALLAADFSGKSDPFCILEVGNDRLQTHTVFRNLNPEWNKVFTFPIKDIHDVLEVTVFDEDGDKAPDFLGKVAIPLLSIKNGQQKGYILKNKDLGQASKGVIYLEMDVIYNPLRASIRTFQPQEVRFIEENPKFSKKILSRNVDRVKKITMGVWNTMRFMNSCFQWESTRRSIIAFLVFIVTVWHFELYMIPLFLLLFFAHNFTLMRTGKVSIQDNLEPMDLGDDDEDEDKESEKKGLIDRLYKVQDIVITVQNVLEGLASFGERIKNTFNWTVPFLSLLACSVLTVATIILYFIPLRYIILIWGIHKFTKKLRNPYAIDSNELLDFLSRVPSDVQKVQYAELKPYSNSGPLRKKRTGL
ncbi:multiple C2 and transmembrane domain-containing protein 2 [Microcaecilia unicolor]|uniref:Multiple C2 and transmembrane domain-containing protein 2 n=1 Tax=Microcaecilia unicolor TaxID=1415580 RepID=A0A6P7WWR2_9AMPH|nr:multiple C2 and transmembrane domain-containing protein 2 [Microcaecilia unicolor]